jgi:hypothetical protein
MKLAVGIFVILRRVWFINAFCLSQLLGTGNVRLETELNLATRDCLLADLFVVCSLLDSVRVWHFFQVLRKSGADEHQL